MDFPLGDFNASPNQHHAAPGVPDMGTASMPHHQIPPCLTNVVRLCDLKDITVRSFSSSSEESVIQAYKCALIQVGLAVCWRVKSDKESSKHYDMGTPGGEVPLTPASPGPAIATSGAPSAAGGSNTASPSLPNQGSNSEMPPPPTYELWTFGTPALQQKLVEEAPPGVMDQVQVSLDVVAVDQAISTLPDCLLLLSDSFTNRAEQLLSKAGFLRLGDCFLPAMDPEDPCHNSPLPGLHMQCFLRDMTLMAVMTVKLKRLSHLGDLSAASDAAGPIDVLVSPQGMPGVVRASWTWQVKDAEAERVAGEWEELGEQLDGLAKYEAAQVPKAVLVEMDGETVLYPSSRVMRLAPSNVATAAYLEHIWMSAGLRGGPQSRSSVMNSVHTFRSFLAGPTIKYDSTQPPTQPFSGYWVFGGIPQHCIKPLTRPRPAIEAAAQGDKDDKNKNGKAAAAAAAGNNKRKQVPPVTIPTGMTTPGGPGSGGPTPTSKRGKKGSGKDTPTGGAMGEAQEAVPTPAGQGPPGGEEVLAAGGGSVKGGKKAAAGGRNRKGPQKETPTPSATTPLPQAGAAPVGGGGDAGGGLEVVIPPAAPLQSPRLGDAPAAPGSARMKPTSAAFSLLNDDFNQSVDVGKDGLMDLGDLNMADEFGNNDELFDFYDSAEKGGAGDGDDLMTDYGSAAVADVPMTMDDLQEEKLEDMDLEEQIEWNMDPPERASSAAPEGSREEAEAAPGGADEKLPDGGGAAGAGGAEAAAGGGGEAAKGGGEAASKTQQQAAEDERKKDEEVLSKALALLPPVQRRPHLLTVRGGQYLGPGMPRGAPSAPNVLYGPTTARPVPEPRAGEEGERKEVKQEAAAAQEDAPAAGPAPEGEQGLGGRRVAPHVKMIAAWRSSQLKVRRPAQSAQRAWLQSRSVAIYYKCCRWTLMDKCLSNMLKGKNRAAEGVSRMVPLEHRLLQQMASTPFDMPARTSALTPSSSLGPEGQYRVHSALLYRPILTRAGLAPHLALEHVMKGEVGEDPRVMMALDPLSLPAPPAAVAATLVQACGALDSLVPGLEQQFKLMDLAELLGEPDSAVEDVAEEMSPPQLLVGHADGDWVEAPPGAIRWWEKMPLAPVSKRKDVLYCVLCSSAEQQGQEVVAAQLLFRELGCVFESMQLGRHKALDARFLSVGPANTSMAPRDGILQVQGFAPNAAAGGAPPPPPAGPKMLSFDEACTRALRAFAIALDDKTAPQLAGGDARPLPVLYILEPDFSVGASWGGPRPEPIPAKARHQWQRAIAKTLSAEAARSPRLLDLVVQTVPAQRVNSGRYMRWFLRDLAAAVYAKGRGRQRAKPQKEGALPVVELDQEVHSFFSGAILGLKKLRVEPRLYEPLLLVAQPQDPSQSKSAGFPDMAKDLLVAPPPEPPNEDGSEPAPAAKEEEKPEEAAAAPPTLHCSYAWSDDGLCLGGAITDTSGETLETFSSLYGGVGPAADPADDKAKENACRLMLRKLWTAVEEWTRNSYAARVRVVLGAVGAHSTRDIGDWKEVLEGAGVGGADSCCIEVVVVHVAVLHSLQLLSTKEGVGAPREEMRKKEFEGWPHPCNHVTSLELAASTVLEPRPSYLLRSRHRFSFPPAVPHLPLPLASSLIVAPATRDEEDTLAPGTGNRASWPVILDVSLLLYITGIRSSKSLEDRHHEQVADVGRAYHNLSWASTHPCFPLRQTVLPFHFQVAKRIAMAAAAVV